MGNPLCTAPLVLVGVLVDLIYPERPGAILAAQASFVVLAAIGHAIVLRCRARRAT